MMNPERIYYLFEIGIKRKQEDYIWPVAGKATADDKVFIVCDGTGRFSNGEIASKLIGRFMARKVLKYGEQKMSGELIEKLLVEARHRLTVYAWKYRLDTELATTFSMIILYNQRALMAWCGNSRIYHLRGGEILFRTEDTSRNAALARGIYADRSPILAATKWIEDVQDGDYFLLCSKGFIESVTDDDIKSLVSQNDKTEIDLAGSFRRLTSEKRPDNYSMYLLRVNLGAQKRSIKSGIIALKRQTSGNTWPISVVAMTLVGLLIIFLYFRKARTSDPSLKNGNQTTQPMDVVHKDSVPGAIVMSPLRKKSANVLRDDSVARAIGISTSRDQSADVLHDDSVANAIVISAPRKPESAAIQAEEKPSPAIQTPIGQKKRVPQLLIRFTTDESCKLKIMNMDLNEVIDWDLTQYDNGNIYLKPGKYSIVATSLISSSKIKTYNFDVKPGYASTTQNLHIKF
jgi:PPM family protein phosphatase